MKTRNGVWVTGGMALALVLAHTLTNGQYGFFRDELGTLGDARHLAWGYVSYPPITPFIARIALALFGPSMIGLRFFAALAQGVVIVLGGLIAGELGGGRTAQIVAAAAIAVAPVSLFAGGVFEYVTFDYLWWVLTVYLALRLLKSGDGRWWLAVGAAVGLGMMTKYTMAFLVTGMAGGLLLTPARRHLRSPWLLAGTGVALVIFLPNLIWQIHHNFISLDFLRSIHARDIRIGRTDGFLWRQALVSSSLFTIPLWIAGLLFYFRNPEGKRFRALGWAFLIVLGLFTVARGRDYYMAPAYPMLLAAGGIASERWPRWPQGLTWAGLIAAFAVGAAFFMPVAPVNSRWWNVASSVNGDLRERIGWQELVENVAKIRDALPPEEQARTAILAGNYGEAGAIDLFGAGYRLPPAISTVNSYWLRGYGDPPPGTLIVVGFSRAFLERNFESCELAGHVTNPYGVRNEETVDHPDIFVCRRPRVKWPELWVRLKGYA